MRYREATRADAAAIAALHAESWRFAYRGALSDEFLDGPVFVDRIRVWEQRMSTPPPNQFVVVAEEGAGLAGFACAYGASDERWGTLLDNLHVITEWQGKGVGKGLMAEVAKWCTGNHPDSGLYLSVLEQNGRARGFYERLGGTDEDGDVWIPPGGGGVRIRLYAWTRDQRAAIPSLAEAPRSEA